jgi:hypothetical protein
MTASAPDLHQTLEYRTATAMARLLPTGLFLIFAGLFIFALLDTDREPLTLVGVALCLLAGGGVIGVALWRRSRHGEPLFTLSQAGLHYRIPWVKERLIPWREIRGVETTAVDARYWMFASSTTSGNWIPSYRTVTFHDVTVVLVSKQFYDSQIFVSSALLRGPGWNANFIPKGELVQIALHHEIVSVEPQALRAAVEARWHAFRERSPVAATRTSVPVTAARAAPTATAAAMGENPRAMSRWDAVKITALLIGIAAALTNIAGVWDLPGQSEDRVRRAKAREERKYWEDAARRNREESKKLEAEDLERRRKLDEDMRRAFGR